MASEGSLEVIFLNAIMMRSLKQDLFAFVRNKTNDQIHINRYLVK
jgi:hypothetical protein